MDFGGVVLKLVTLYSSLLIWGGGTSEGYHIVCSFTLHSLSNMAAHDSAAVVMLQAADDQCQVKSTWANIR